MKINQFDYSYFPSEIKRKENKLIKRFYSEFAIGITVGVMLGATLLTIMNLITNPIN